MALLDRLDTLAQCKTGLMRMLGLALGWALLTVGLKLFIEPAFIKECKGSALDFMMGFYSEAQAFDFIKGCGDNGRRIYLWWELFDILVYSVSVASAIALGVLRTVRKLPKLSSATRWLVVLPLLAIMADWSENLASIAMIVIIPARNPALGTYLGVITPIKWYLYYLATALAVPGLILTIGECLRRSSRK